MANVYSVAQTNMAKGTLDVDTGGATLKCRVITDAQAVSFDEADATMTDVMANGGSALTATAETDITLTSQAATQVTNGVDLKANKVTYSAVGAGETWAAAIIYDATTDTNDGTRIPIAHIDFTADLPTSGVDMEVRWSGTDGVGIYATSRNA